MPSAEAANKRRSSRVFIRIPVWARGRNLQGRPFQQTTETAVVNAHGGLIYLNETLEMGGELTIMNPATEEEQECRIVFMGSTNEKGQRIGIEFLSPAPHFWGVEFPPPDWPSPGDASKSAPAS